MPTTAKTSLKDQGFTIEPIKAKNEVEHGWVFRVKGPQPIFYIRKTRSGRLLAYRSKDAKTESTINGLANFKQQGSDLVGHRYVPKKEKPKLAIA